METRECVLGVAGDSSIPALNASLSSGYFVPDSASAEIGPSSLMCTGDHSAIGTVSYQSGGNIEPWEWSDGAGTTGSGKFLNVSLCIRWWLCC